MSKTSEATLDIKDLEALRDDMEETSFLGSVKGGVVDKTKALIGFHITRWLMRTVLSTVPDLFFLFVKRYITSHILLDELQAREGSGDIPLSLPNGSYRPSYKLVNREWDHSKSGVRLLRLPTGGWILANVGHLAALGVPPMHVLIPFWYRAQWENLVAERYLRMGPRKSMTVRECASLGEENKSSRLRYRVKTVPYVRRIDELPINSKIREAVWEHVNLLKNLWLSDTISDREISRNIAFFGDPGTGKSAVAYAMAREFRDTVTILPPSCTVSELQVVKDDVPVFTVVIADEVDKSSMWRATEKDPVDILITELRNQPAGVSDILAYMSGPLAPQSCTTVVISNYPDKIDHRTYREGRVRAELHFTAVDDAGIRFYLKNWHKLDVPEHYRFVEDKTTAQIFALEEKLDNPIAFMEALRVPKSKSDSATKAPWVKLS